VGGEPGGGGDSGGAGAHGDVNGSLMRRGCRCEAGYVGARCHLFLDQLESEKVERVTRWCLAAWKGTAEDGAAVAVVPCSRHPKTAAQQEWVVELRVSSDAGLEVRPRSQPGLCLTAPPLHTKEGV